MLETLDDVRKIMDRLELHDGIEAFFSCLPSPEEFDNYVKEHGHSDDEALYRATLSSGFRASGKNDVHKYLLARLPRNLKDMVKYWDSLAHLSTKKETISLEGESAMAVQLRFLNWVVRGRNEAEKDLMTTGTTTCTDAQRRTAVRLPQEANRACAACHKKPAKSSSFSCCAGCAIESDCGTYNVSCTYYCGPACQKEHWATHKVFCNPRRKVIRAAWLLQELMKFVEAAGSYTPWEGLGVEDGITYLKPAHQGNLHFMGAADVHVVLPAFKEVNAQTSAAWIAGLNANNCI
ncbi:zinc finger MYND domain-containing protein [Microdochium nivale]|nr:zinc finger MYND domain-containing protein [Microdochium nivale]